MKDNNESGVLIIEAIVSLSTFIFALMMFLTVANIYTVQSKMQVALNTAAKQVSEYGYVFTMTGALAKEQGLAQEGQEAGKKIEDVITNVDSLFKNVGNLVSDDYFVSGGIGKIEDNVQNVKDSFTSSRDAVNKIKSDPAGFFKSLGLGLAGKGIDYVQNEAAEGFCKYLVKAHLTTSEDGDADAYLRMLGVVGGFEGIDFSKSKMYENGSSRIAFVASYDVQIAKFLPIELKYHIEQAAQGYCWTIYGWNVDHLKKDDTSSGNKNNSGTASEWKTKSDQDRQNEIINELKNVSAENPELNFYGCDDWDPRAVYSPVNNEMMVVGVYNPLVDSEGNAVSVENVDKDKIGEYLSGLLSAMPLPDSGEEVKLNGYDDTVTMSEYSTSIYLVIPENEGLETVFDEYVKTYKEVYMVDIIVVSGFGSSGE